MPPPRPDAATVRAALAEIARQRAELDRMRAELLPLLDPADLVSLKDAVAATGSTREALMKRAQRGAGVKRDGRWYFPRTWVDNCSGHDVHPRCPDASTIQRRRSARISAS